MKLDTKEFEAKMQKSISAYEIQLADIRAGRANPGLLDKIEVDYYGAPTKLNQMAEVKATDARTIVISPWDASTLKNMEKAILASDLGITPVNDGKTLRLSFPQLTEERRKQLVKQCGKESEQAKVSIRNARRDTNDKLKKAIKDGLSEDLEKDAEADLQKMHDKYIKKVEELLANKEKEIMTV